MYRESSHSESWDAANDLLQQRAAAAVMGATPAAAGITMNRLFDVLIDTHRLERRHSVYETRTRLNKHLRPILGELQARRMTTAVMRDYITLRLKEEAAPATVNRELAIVSRAWKLGQMETPPLVTADLRIPRLKEDNVRQGFVTDEQYRALIAAAPEYFRPILSVAYHTGMRRGELLALDWRHVAADRIEIPAANAKNERPRLVPVYGDMRAYLDFARAAAGNAATGPVFQRGGRPIRSIRGVWAQTAKAAGLPDLLFHDLRRSAVRNMVRNHIPEKLAMSVSGHRTRDVFERYNIISESDFQFLLDRFEPKPAATAAEPPKRRRPQ